MTNRRAFITKAATATIAAVTIPGIISSAFAESTGKSKVRLKDGDTVLFQGDSITDWGRDKTKMDANNFAALGSGYVLPAAGSLLNKHAGKNLKVYNKGISGNKVYQLAERWDADCLNLKPNVLSILIGVNDFWHTLTNGYTGTGQVYNADYRKLLDRTKQALPEIQFIIGEPFAVKGVKAVDEKWYPAFDAYRTAAKQIAKDYGAVWIPYQDIFDKAQEIAPGSYWTNDGVHPSVAGANLMAQAWLETIKG